MSEMKLDANWTDDCQGKKDYDGTIAFISTRYWPRGGGFSIVGRSENAVYIEDDDERPSVKPSATCKLMIRCRDADSYYVVEADFEGESFEEVKAKVETWAQQQMDRAVKAIKAEFCVDPLGSPN